MPSDRHRFQLKNRTGDWLIAPDVAAQHKICEQIQLQALQDVPYVPLGEFHIRSACRSNLTGFSEGTPVFYGVKRI